MALRLQPLEEGQSLLETMEVMGDPELMRALRKGARDIAAGRLATSDEVRKDLGR